MDLIITEKPSVAKDIATAIKASKRGDGYIEGQNCIITWAIGHLLELAMPHEYNPEWKTWSLANLPIIPQEFQLKPIDNTAKQLKCVSLLLKRKDIQRVIIATDAGREGELIAREILTHVKFSQPNKLYRLWTSEALTPAVVTKALSSLKPAKEYDRLYNAAIARRNADWLVGMNLSRAVTCALGNSATFSVGRVQTAVLAMLVDRKRQRVNFVPIPYWNVSAQFQGPKGTWNGTYITKDGQTRIDDKRIAETIAKECNSKPATVTSVQKKDQKQAPPLLFSLTVLQQEASRLYGLSAQDTLAVAQKLYETYKVISYPRTDSQVLATSNVQLAKDVLSKLKTTYQDLVKHVVPKLVDASNTRVFNDAKLTDHHALIPLAPFTDPGTTENERKIYDLILRRFIAAFCADYEYITTTIITTVTTHNFQTQGKTDKVQGWKAVYAFTKQTEDNLPALAKGDTAQTIEAKVVEKQTEPPPEYTDATLLKDMTNPAKYLDDQSLKSIFKGEVGLGTQATRAEIIETLIRRAYAERDKKIIRATDKGCYLIDTLRQFPELAPITQPDNTAKWESVLEAIAQGQHQNNQFEENIKHFVIQAVNTLKSAKGLQPFHEQKPQGNLSSASNRPSRRTPQHSQKSTRTTSKTSSRKKTASTTKAGGAKKAPK